MSQSISVHQILYNEQIIDFLGIILETNSKHSVVSIQPSVNTKYQTLFYIFVGAEN